MGLIATKTTLAARLTPRAAPTAWRSTPMRTANNPIPPADVPCERCPNQMMASEARVSQRALGLVLCWRCRKHHGPCPTVHQLPRGCSALVSGSGYGLWNATLTAPDGRQFTGAARSDYAAVSCARNAAVAAGAL